MSRATFQTAGVAGVVCLFAIAAAPRAAQAGSCSTAFCTLDMNSQIFHGTGNVNVTHYTAAVH